MSLAWQRFLNRTHKEVISCTTLKSKLLFIKKKLRL